MIIHRALVGLLVCALPAPSSAQSGSPRLGTLSFPTSATSPAAQEAFTEGLLWMHSFEYERAAKAFRHAQQVEPGFAMAYWGEAMTHNHPIWDERDAGQAQAVLERLGPTAAARARLVATPRERAWFAAAESLWASGPKAPRDTLYFQAMQRLHAAHPDEESQAFLALAWIGLSQGVRDVPAYMRGGALGLDLLARAPDHPGAAHYVIHAFDDPDHAILALHAARAYSRIAPDAGHAQHMTTHIFLALGMWDEVARQNVVAMQAATGNSDSVAWRPGHYTWWLNYARLQQGKWTDAGNWLRHQRATLPADASMRQRQLLRTVEDEWQVNTGWFDQLPDRLVDTTNQTATSLLVLGLAFAQPVSTHRDLLARWADRLTAFRAAHPEDEDAPLVEPQLRALLLLVDGNVDSAIATLQPAVDLEAARPIDFGPPAAIRPAHEAMAELLLRAGRFEGATAAYARALARTPGRSRALAGQAIAARMSGDEALADRAMQQLRANLHDGDPNVIETLLRLLFVK